MSGDFSNVYDDAFRAESYDSIEFPGTYFLAYRDLPGLIRSHVTGRRALDFGCGAGRSTRFLKELGFEAVGADISERMLERARARDPEGAYLLVEEGDLGPIRQASFDLIFSSFTFDNVLPDTKARLFEELSGRLVPGGRWVNLVSAPTIYRHEWLSFSTKDFPENLTARDGDRVRIVMLDVEDRRPVEDILCTDEGYRDLYARTGLQVLAEHRPLGEPGDPYDWVNETRVSPWAIYVLERAVPFGVGGDMVGDGAGPA